MTSVSRKPKHQSRILTEEKSHEVGALHEHWPRNSAERLAQETGLPEKITRTATESAQNRGYAIFEAGIGFRLSYLQSADDDELDPNCHLVQDRLGFNPIDVGTTHTLERSKSEFRARTATP